MPPENRKVRARCGNILTPLWNATAHTLQFIHHYLHAGVSRIRLHADNSISTDCQQLFKRKSEEIRKQPGGPALNGSEARVPHPCALCKCAVAAILHAGPRVRPLKNAQHPPAASHAYETTRPFLAPRPGPSCVLLPTRQSVSNPGRG